MSRAATCAFRATRRARTPQPSPTRYQFLRCLSVLAPASKRRKAIVWRETEPRAGCDARASKNDGSPGAAIATAPTTSQEPRTSPHPAAPKPPGFTLLWQRPTAVLDDRDPRAVTEAHRRRIDPGRVLAATPHLDWAALLRRTYEVDVLEWPRCRGPARIVDAITGPAVIRKILEQVREPPARPPRSGAKEPEFDDAADGEASVEPDGDVG